MNLRLVGSDSADMKDMDLPKLYNADGEPNADGELDQVAKYHDQLEVIKNYIDRESSS